MAVNYTTVGNLYTVLPNLKTGVSDLTSADLVKFIEDAENEIHGKLAKYYTVPVAGAPLLETLATDIAIYRVLSRRIFTQTNLKDSVWPDRYKEAVDMLDSIADGKTTLVDSSGNVVADITTHAEVWSDKSGYLPTFHEGGRTEQVIDPQKLEDIEDERDLNSVGNILS